MHIELTAGMKLRMLRINELKKKLGHRELTTQAIVENAIAAYWLAIERRATKCEKE